MTSVLTPPGKINNNNNIAAAPLIISADAFLPTGFDKPPTMNAPQSPTTKHAPSTNSPACSPDRDTGAVEFTMQSERCEFTLKSATHEKLPIDLLGAPKIVVTAPVDGVWAVTLRASFVLQARALLRTDVACFMFAFLDSNMRNNYVKVNKCNLTASASEPQSDWQFTGAAHKGLYNWRIHDGVSRFVGGNQVYCSVTLLLVQSETLEEAAEQQQKRRRGRPAKRDCPYCATQIVNKKQARAKPMDTILYLNSLLTGRVDTTTTTTTSERSADGNNDRISE